MRADENKAKKNNDCQCKEIHNELKMESSMNKSSKSFIVKTINIYIYIYILIWFHFFAILSKILQEGDTHNEQTISPTFIIHSRRNTKMFCMVSITMSSSS